MVELVLAAIGVLMLGTLVYLLGRGSQTYFVPDWLYAGGAPTPIFAWICEHLPSFAHTFAFTLLTSAVLWPWRVLAPSICFVWFTIECLLEVGQLDVLARHITGFVPSWFDGVPILEVTSSYFINGTFDPLDIFSIALGSLSAYTLARVIRKKETYHATPR